MNFDRNQGMTGYVVAVCGGLAAVLALVCLLAALTIRSFK